MREEGDQWRGSFTVSREPRAFVSGSVTVVCKVTWRTGALVWTGTGN